MHYIFPPGTARRYCRRPWILPLSCSINDRSIHHINRFVSIPTEVCNNYLDIHITSTKTVKLSKYPQPSSIEIIGMFRYRYIGKRVFIIVVSKESNPWKCVTHSWTVWMIQQSCPVHIPTQRTGNPNDEWQTAIGTKLFVSMLLYDIVVSNTITNTRTNVY